MYIYWSISQWMKLGEFSGKHLLQTQMIDRARVLSSEESNQQPAKRKSFYPHRFPGNHCCPTPFVCTHIRRTGFKRSLKIPLSARFIGVVIGFITPLHHSAALPFAMVDEPLRPLKHGRLKDWGWGRGGMKGGWRKARCLGSLLLHLLQHPRMFSIHLFSCLWRSPITPTQSPLEVGPPATPPLSLSTNKSEWTDRHTL